MTGPSDTVFPTAEPGTTPDLDAIPAGRAQMAVSLALAVVHQKYLALADSIVDLDAVASGIARKLDATAPR